MELTAAPPAPSRPSRWDIARQHMRDNPVRFAQDILGVQLWHKQEEILHALRDHRRVAVKAGNGIGKGFTAAVAALWFLASHKPATVLTTAPTARQVRHILWREIHRVHQNAACGQGGHLFHTRLNLDDDRFALGLSTDQADQFQGFHSPNMLIIVDEAEGVSDTIFEAIEAVMTSGNVKLLLIGNPTSDDGAFRRAFHQDRSLYHTLTISALESPNVASNQVIIPGLTTREWVEERETLWGHDSSIYQARVLGQFPNQAQNTLISLAHIDQAIRRHPPVIPAPHTVIPAQAGTHVTPRSIASWNGNEKDDSPVIPAPLHTVIPAPPSVIPAQAGTHVTPRSIPSRNGDEKDDSPVIPAPLHTVIPAQAGTHVTPRSIPSRNGNEKDDSPVIPAPLHTVIPVQTGTHVNPFPLERESRDEGEQEANTPTVLAVDVARYGKDKSVLLLASPHSVLRIETRQGIDTMELTGHIVDAYRRWSPDRIVVDEIGIGAGVVDRLKELGLPVKGINVSRPARRQPKTYANLRAEGYFHLRDLFAQGLITIPDDPELAGQLASIRHIFKSAGRLFIEGKEEAKARGIPSPDKADALMLAFLPPPPSFKLHI